MRIPHFDEPEPDAALVRGSRDDYRDRFPDPGDIALLSRFPRVLSVATAVKSGLPMPEAASHTTGLSISLIVKSRSTPTRYKAVIDLARFSRWVKT